MRNKKEFYVTLFSLALPLVFQQLVTFSVGLVDSIMVGTLGDYAISGVHICNQVFTVLQMIIIGINSAIQIFGAQFWGKQDIASIRSVISMGMIFSVGTGLAFFALCMLSPSLILRIFTNDSLVLAEAVRYMRTICWSYPLFALTQVLVSGMRSVENVNVGVTASLISLFLNTVLNYVFIFGVDSTLLQLAPLGVRGAAIATVIARTVEGVVMVGYVFWIDHKVQFSLKDIRKPDNAMQRRFVKYGLPVIGGQFVWGVNMLGQSMVLGHISTAALAASSIVGVMNGFLYISKEGFGQAVGVITSKTVGSGDYERMKGIAYRVQVIFVVLGLISCVEVLLLRDLFIAWYQVESETADVARAFLNVLAITIIGTSYQSACLSGLVKAGGDTAFVFRNDSFFVFCVVLPLSALAAFAFRWPAWAVFACLKSDQILKCFVAAVKINRFKWIKNITEA